MRVPNTVLLHSSAFLTTHLIFCSCLWRLNTVLRPGSVAQDCWLFGQIAERVVHWTQDVVFPISSFEAIIRLVLTHLTFVSWAQRLRYLWLEAQAELRTLITAFIWLRIKHFSTQSCSPKHPQFHRIWRLLRNENNSIGKTSTSLPDFQCALNDICQTACHPTISAAVSSNSFCWRLWPFCSFFHNSKAALKTPLLALLQALSFFTGVLKVVMLYSTTSSLNWSASDSKATIFSNLASASATKSTVWPARWIGLLQQSFAENLQNPLPIGPCRQGRSTFACLISCGGSVTLLSF